MPRSAAKAFDGGDLVEVPVDERDPGAGVVGVSPVGVAEHVRDHGRDHGRGLGTGGVYVTADLERCRRRHGDAFVVAGDEREVLGVIAQLDPTGDEGRVDAVAVPAEAHRRGLRDRPVGGPQERFGDQRRVGQGRSEVAFEPAIGCSPVSAWIRVFAEDSAHAVNRSLS